MSSLPQETPRVLHEDPYYHSLINMSTPMQHEDDIEKQLEEKTRRRRHKKKPKMKVSGRSVLHLKRVIAEKGSKSPKK